VLAACACHQAGRSNGQTGARFRHCWNCVPLTTTAEEAAECVAMTRYPPHGRRGFGPFVAHSRWGQTFEESLIQLSNTARRNLLIETKAAIQNIDAICAVPGISALALAGLDLSVDLGCPGRFDAPSSRQLSKSSRGPQPHPKYRGALQPSLMSRRSLPPLAVTRSAAMSAIFPLSEDKQTRTQIAENITLCVGNAGPSLARSQG
jgi:hypothetical protein